MPKRQKITSGTISGDHYEVDQRVCIAGRGTANPVHHHGRVKRFTQTMMFVEYTWRRGEREGVAERRYRLGRGYLGREVGASEYGGTYVAPRCQRPRPTT